MILFTGDVPGVATSQGKYRLSSDKDEKTSLILSEAEMEDGGEYTCRIMIRSSDEINVTHTVVVTEGRKRVQAVGTLNETKFRLLYYTRGHART